VLIKLGEAQSAERNLSIVRISLRWASPTDTIAGLKNAKIAFSVEPLASYAHCATQTKAVSRFHKETRSGK
jgi:hypothetical protein